MDESLISSLGTNPIAGPSPGGVDSSDDPDHIFVLGEMSKVGRVDAVEPDWYQLDQVATRLLQTKTKNVEIAAALGLALFKREGYAGLSAALDLFNNLVRNFWDNLFPARPRVRKARIEGFIDTFTEGTWFRQNAPQDNEFDHVDAALARTEALKAALAERMPDDPFEVLKFIRGLQEIASRRAPASGAAPASPAPSSSGAASAGMGGFAAPTEIADPGTAVKSIMTAVSFLRKARSADPIPYAVARAVRWSTVVLPASDAGKYEIQPPENSTVEALQHQLNNRMWDKLVNSAEAAFRSGDPLWLDVQRFVCTAMAGLGAEYDLARQAIVSGLAGLVRRLGDGLYELRFKNSQPLCGPETKLWIESQVAPAQTAGAGGNGLNDKLAEVVEEARKLAGAGEFKEALAHVQSEMRNGSPGRDAFLGRLQMAALCADGGRLELAAALLDQCSQEVRHHHLDAWEPSLAVQALQSLYRCRKQLASINKETSHDALAGLRDLFAWLCQLDPLAALAIEPSGK